MEGRDVEEDANDDEENEIEDVGKDSELFNPNDVVGSGDD